MDGFELFLLSVEMGAEIIRNGGEINRAKDTVTRINRVRNEDCAVFALPDLIMVQSGKNFLMRKIGSRTLDMAELDRLNSLSRRICRGESRDIEITLQSGYSRKTVLLFSGIAVFLFCLFFGGSVIDSLIAGVTGCLITAAPYRRSGLPTFTANLIDAFVVGVLSQLFALINAGIHGDRIIIGAIMVLVPGLNIQSAMRDMLSGEILAGASELIESVMSALAIALSVALSLFIFKYL